MSRPDRPTLVQVAAAAGVSPATASRALRRVGSVDAATRDRVAAAAKALGWQDPDRGDPARRVGRPRRRRDLGLLVEPELCQAFSRVSAFYGRLFWGLSLAAQRADRRLRLLPAPAGPGALRAFRALDLDGAIIHGHQGDLDLAGIERIAPVVVVNGTPGLPVATVGPDDQEGAMLLLRHVRAQGHVRIASFGILDGAAGQGPNRHHVARLKTMVERGPELGLQVRQVVLPGRDRPLDEVALRQVRGWLAEPDPPTAILLPADVHALAFLRAAQALGVAVPGRLAIAGFDDTETCTAVDPALTSVAQPLEAMGEAAIDLLMARLDDPDRPPEARWLSPSLVVRGSTAG